MKLINTFKKNKYNLVIKQNKIKDKKNRKNKNKTINNKKLKITNNNNYHLN
jgi:hypothetical protein